MKKAIYIGLQAQTDSVYSDETVQRLSVSLDFPYGSKTFSKEELEQYDLHDVSFLFSTWGMPELTEDEIASYFPVLEAVFYAAGSVQDFARPFLKRSVRIFSAWAANGIPVAETALAEIILASKGFFSRLHIPGSGGVLDESWKAAFPGKCPGNYDITVGIIGAGMIGSMVIERIHSILSHVRVLVFDPFLSEERAKELMVTKCDLEKLFSESDVISNHLADNDKTKGMLNYSLFSRLKDNAVFINTGRGAQVIENDLVAALTECPSRSAVLDVTFPEPSPAGHPFYDMKNVFITPHIAGSLGNEVHRLADFMADELSLLLNNSSPRFEVSLSMLDIMA